MRFFEVYTEKIIPDKLELKKKEKATLLTEAKFKDKTSKTHIDEGNIYNRKIENMYSTYI